MKSSDQVGITFANLVLGRGVLNSVINVTLAAYQFTPEGGKVEADPVVVSRLRMDIPCAVALRDELTKLLDTIEHPTPPPQPVADVAEGKEGTAH